MVHFFNFFGFPQFICLRSGKISISFKNQKNLISKGSKQHKLGKPYNNKEIEENIYKEKPVPIKYGEFVFFTPALVHGQVLNKDENNTRFSFDFFQKNILFGTSSVGREGSGSPDNEILYFPHTSPMTQPNPCLGPPSP